MKKRDLLILVKPQIRLASVKSLGWVMAAHGGRGRRISEHEASLVDLLGYFLSGVK